MALVRFFNPTRALPVMRPDALVKFGRALRSAMGLLLFLSLGGLWILLPRHIGRALPERAFSILLWGFGITVRLEGYLPEKGELCIANHVSWTDIPVLGVTIGAGFVAKKDVRQWPIIGTLADRYGCLFVERDRRASAGLQADALATRLEDRNIILFPEGTTGNGQVLLPFRSSLIEAAAGRLGRVVPITIVYRWANGRAFGNDCWSMFAWVGDANLLTHACTLAIADPIHVDVIIAGPIESDCRKTLATSARGVIERHLALNSTV